MVHPAFTGIDPDSVIDKRKPVPLHYQLELFLRQAISSGRLGEGQPLPTEQELQDYFQLSRTPVRQALGKLVSDGLVERVRSRGTFVLPQLFEEELAAFSSFTEEILRAGHEPSARLLSFERMQAPPDVATALELSAGGDMFYFRRLRLIDDVPAGLVSSYVAAERSPELVAENFTQRGPGQSTYFVLEQIHGHKLIEAAETFEATNLTDEEAAHLGLPPGHPILCRSRITLILGGVPLVLERALYRVRYHLTWQGRRLLPERSGFSTSVK